MSTLEGKGLEKQKSSEDMPRGNPGPSDPGIFNPAQNGAEAPLPRPERKRRRTKEDRGLPPDENLQQLVQVYLETQRELWPELEAKKLLPKPDSEVINSMVQDFKSRHRKAVVNPVPLKRLARQVERIGGGYFRYSCDNSNPLSISDQMVNCLRKAREQGFFIPWEYVYADFSVTGLDASRQGYSAYKELIADSDQLIQTTYIDDFSRASRDDIEWWKLAHLSKRLKIGLVGASDGFDLSQPDWDMKVTLYALFSRLFIKQLREKVQRGMSGAARRGTCLGKLPLGFTRVVKTSPEGQPVLGGDGKPIHVPCHDPRTIEYRREMFELFVDRKWSAHEIAKHMNLNKVDGWDGWTAASVKKLLWSPTAIGIFIWNQFRREYDYDQEKSIRVRNPREEWVIHIDKSLAVVEIDLWKQARRRLAAARKNSPLTGRKQSRNQLSATTLFSGTLVCGYCGKELVLQRSAKNYKQMGCLDGWTGVHECQLTSSKSVKVIEQNLLRYLQEILLTPETLIELVEKTNQWIEQESTKPKVDLKPLHARRDKIARGIEKWTRLIDSTDDFEQCDVHSKKIITLQKELKELDQQIREAKATVYRPVKPVSRKDLEVLLQELREVMNSDIPVAADAIRKLTGPITIRQEPFPDGKRGSKWFATFSPRFLNLVEVCCGSEAVASLRAAGMQLESEPVTVPLDRVPEYVRLAPEFKRLREGGASIQSIASAHKISWQYAKEILHFAETGERPQWKGHPKGNGTATKRRKYTEIAEQVVELRDQQKLSFAAIARKLGVGGSTVRRAYDFLRPEAVRLAAESGQRPQRTSDTSVLAP